MKLAWHQPLVTLPTGSNALLTPPTVPRAAANGGGGGGAAGGGWAGGGGGEGDEGGAVTEVVHEVRWPSWCEGGLNRAGFVATGHGWFQQNKMRFGRRSLFVGFSERKCEDGPVFEVGV